MEEKVFTKEEKEKLRKERQKRRKYRLLILLLLMLGTGTMLATSTYAWFTSNKNVSVESLKVNIEAKNGIQISADATNWKSIVQKTDLVGAKTGKYTNAINQIPEILEPVSTTGIPDAGKLPMYYGVVESDEETGNYILTSTKTTELDNNTTRGDDDQDPAKFIAFDLFFKVKSETKISLQAGSGVSAVTAEGEQDTGIKNAARIAFIVEGSLADGTALDTIQALNGGTNAIIWEPNAGSHTAAGVAQARDVYNKSTTEGDTNPALTYVGVKSAITLENKVLLNSEDTNYFTAVDPTIKTNKGFDANVDLLTLSAGITKVRVYMWVEGQDVDCENNASGGQISFDLKITTPA